MGMPQPGDDSPGGCAAGCLWGMLFTVVLWIGIGIMTAWWNGVKFDG